MLVYNKPSVKDYEWHMWDNGEATYGYGGDRVELYRQVDPTYAVRIDHYRLKVNGKWVRKTFFGETAWRDVERYASDHYGVLVTA